jgi:hypothetical protein
MKMTGAFGLAADNTLGFWEPQEEVPQAVNTIAGTF